MKISIISNDKRYPTVNSLFIADGYNSAVEKPSDFSGSDVLVLSVKNEYSEEELECIFDKISDDTVVFKGDYKIPQKTDKVYNYAKDETFILKNAYLTSEAVPSFVKEATGRDISSSKVLILGYGRIGKYLSEKLKGMKNTVYVYARRKESREEAKNNGIIPLDTVSHIYKYDFIFNTVPEIIVPESEAKKAIKCGASIIELASPPGGFEDKTDVINGGGLPGKILPTFAAQAVYETISKILSSIIAERTLL